MFAMIGGPKHVSIAQDWPLAHATPQAPQFSLLSEVLTHVPEQQSVAPFPRCSHPPMQSVQLVSVVKGITAMAIAVSTTADAARPRRIERV